MPQYHIQTVDASLSTKVEADEYEIEFGVLYLRRDGDEVFIAPLDKLAYIKAVGVDLG